MIKHHHLHLRSSYVNILRDSAMTILDELPTTIEFDEGLIPSEKMRNEKVK